MTKRSLILLLLAALAWASPARAKVDVDFDPSLDFSRFKTFAYIGGVEQLNTMQVNPNLINDRVHRAVTAALTARGLQEVQVSANPDLVVRYWASSQTQINVAASGAWGPYSSYIGAYWGYMYNQMYASSTKTGMLVVDLIDAKPKELAWRLYIVQKIYNVDKAWKSVKKDFDKGFQSYPPSPKQIEAKKKERAAHPPAAGS